jgi:hypothetical protein
MVLAQGTYAEDSEFKDFASGRYEVRKKPAAGDTALEKLGILKKKSATRGPASAEEVKPKPPKISIESSAPAEVMAVEASETIGPKPSNQISKELVMPGLKEQWNSLFTDQRLELSKFFKTNLKTNDIRNNILETQLSLGVGVNDSKSNLVYRDYYSFFQIVDFKANLWMTPGLGLSGRYWMTMTGDISSTTKANSKVPISYEGIDLEFMLRKFVNLSEKSDSFTFSLLYTDLKTNVPTNESSRAKLESSGLGLKLSSRWPTSDNYASVFGASYFPRIKHTEIGTGLALKSGSGSQHSRIGFQLGGEFKFERQSQIIWDAGYSVEKNIFSGDAFPSEPSGNIPNNVSVTNSILLFTLGYRWGH